MSNKNDRFNLEDIPLKQNQHDENVLFIPENVLMNTTIAHVILNDLDSFSKL